MPSLQLQNQHKQPSSATMYGADVLILLTIRGPLSFSPPGPVSIGCSSAMTLLKPLDGDLKWLIGSNLFTSSSNSENDGRTPLINVLRANSTDTAEHILADAQALPLS